MNWSVSGLNVCNYDIYTVRITSKHGRYTEVFYFSVSRTWNQNKMWVEIIIKLSADYCAWTFLTKQAQKPANPFILFPPHAFSTEVSYSHPLLPLHNSKAGCFWIDLDRNQIECTDLASQYWQNYLLQCIGKICKAFCCTRETFFKSVRSKNINLKVIFPHLYSDSADWCCDVCVKMQILTQRILVACSQTHKLNANTHKIRQIEEFSLQLLKVIKHSK